MELLDLWLIQPYQENMTWDTMYLDKIRITKSGEKPMKLLVRNWKINQINNKCNNNDGFLYIM